MKKSLISFVLLMFSLASCNVNILSKYGSYDDASDYHCIDKNGEAFNNISSIELNWVKGNVNIFSSSEYEYLTIYEKTSEIYTSEYMAHLLVKDNVLKIQYCKSNISYPNSYIKTLDIYIPRSLQLEELSISSVSAPITIGDITTKELDIDNVSGKINLNSINATSIEYDGVSGSLSCSVSEDTSYIDIDQVSGNSIVSLNQNITGFSATIDTVSGELNLDFDTIYSNGKYIYLDRSNLEIEFDSVSGNLSIVKQNNN